LKTPLASPSAASSAARSTGLWPAAPPEPLKGALGACRPHFVGAMVFSAGVNLLYLAPTLYMLQVYDRVTPTGSGMTLMYVTLVVAYALATLSLLDHVRQRLLVRVGLRLDRLLSAQILARLMARARAGAPSAMVGQAMRDFDVFRQSLGGPAALALIDLPWTPIYVAAAFMLHPALGLLTIFGGAVLIALNLANQRATRARLQAAHKANAVAYASQDALVQNAEAIRALGMRQALINRQEAERGIGLGLTAEAQLLGGRYAGATKFVRLFLQSLALAAGAWLAVKHQISAGSIIAASVLMTRALQPIEQVVASWGVIMQGRSAYEGLCTLFTDTEGDAAARTQLPAPAGRLQVERVLTRVAGNPEALLRNITFAVEPGCVLGVIGPSGAGKTTLARVIAGATPPDLGVVRIDGASMTDWDGDALARHIGYLPQNPALLEGTVKDNISRFAAWTGEDAETIDRQAIEAARSAGVHEIILRLPKGYDTKLGPGGSGLSAGQAQRIALARALYGAPALLVLDEPNSALDAPGEAALAAAIQAAKARGAAIVIVAHRAGVLALADHLLVLRDGAVEQWGPKAAVLGRIAAAAEVRPQPAEPAPETTSETTSGTPSEAALRARA
jgi:PrtD family type I secretion system ABC transporter